MKERDFTLAVNNDIARVTKEFPSAFGTDTYAKDTFKEYRTVFAHYFQYITEQHRAEKYGGIICHRLTDLIDCFVLHAYTMTVEKVSTKDGCALIALAGYGRQELNFSSDIDLLFLTTHENVSTYEEPISEMLRFLWDMKLDLSHFTLTVEECLNGAEKDPIFGTSLLERRFLAGTKDFSTNLDRQFSLWLKSDEGRNLFIHKIEERNRRLDQYHNAVQVQEPNIRECPGGLRDVHTARWLSVLVGYDNSISSLFTLGLLTKQDRKDYEEDLDFLLRVRNTLHLLTGKKTDILDHLILPEVAKHMGYIGKDSLPVEKFMHDYYMRAGRVRILTDSIVQQLLLRFSDKRKPSLALTPDGFLIGETVVGISPPVSFMFTKHPETFIKLFALAGAGGLDIAPETQTSLRETLTKPNGGFTVGPEIRSALHEVMNMREGVGRALRLMHEFGILTKLIPELDKISWHYQYDFYHTYTTDEHSIRVVENLELFAHGGGKVPPQLAEIMADVPAKSALYLAGLLHDIGKGGGPDHSQRGERIAAQVLKRLEFDDRTIALVRFLIREHLLMSHISQRRDIDDEDTIAGFIKCVGSTGRLRMLTLLTFADLMALSELALSDWKKTLLLNLFQKTLKLIEKGYDEKEGYKENKRDEVVRALKKSFTPKKIRSFLDGLPEQYIRVTQPADIASHIRGAEMIKRHGVGVTFKHHGDLSLLTVIARDYPRALSDICGTITSSDINIIGARIFTGADNTIIDTFLVVSGSGEKTISPEAQHEFKEHVTQVMSGKISTENLIEQFKLRWKRRRTKAVFAPPRVNVHNDISKKYTVIDVFASDYTGLLYDITSVLSSLGLDIHTAKIGTDEDQVADAFYVQKRGGGKIKGEKTLKKISDAIIAKLNEAYR
jgi:[protein-PII] uridylyltransferase